MIVSREAVDVISREGGREKLQRLLNVCVDADSCGSRLPSEAGHADCESGGEQWWRSKWKRKVSAGRDRRALMRHHGFHVGSHYCRDWPGVSDARCVKLSPDVDSANQHSRPGSSDIEAPP